MADRYDGSINIRTLVDNKGINKGLKQTEKEIDRLTTQFEKQSAKIKQQNAELENLRSKLQAIAKGEKPQELIELEKQLKSVDKETKAVENTNKEIITQYEKAVELAESQRALGFSEEQLAPAVAEADKLAEKLRPVDDELKKIEEKAKIVKDRIKEIKLDPTSSQDFQELTNQIEQGTLGLEAAKDRANELQSELGKLETPFAQTVEAIRIATENVTNEIKTQQGEYETLLRVYAKAEESLDAARASGDNMAQELAQTNMDRAISDIEKIDVKTKLLNYEAEKLQIAFDKVTMDPENYSDMMKLRAETSATTFMLNDAAASSRNLSSEIGNAFDTGKIIPAREEFEEVDKKINETTNITNILNGTFEKMSSGIKKIGSSILKIVGSMKLFNKESKSASNGFEKLLSRIKNLVTAVFVFNLIRKGLRQLQEGLYSALKQNDQFVNSLAQIKGNLLTAFQPIYNAVLPAINALMSALARITAYVAVFTNAVFGKSIKQSQAAAAAMKDQAKATAAAGKAAKNASSSIDELNVVSEDTSGAGAGIEDIDFSAITVPETAWIDEFAQKLKELIPDLDYFYNLGLSVGEKIVEGLQAIPWDAIRAWGVSFIQKFAAFMNGLVDSGVIQQIGTTLAEAINTAVLWLYTWLTSFNWLNLGTAVAEGLNNAISKTNWSLLGATFASKWNALINTLYGFITTFDWAKFGKSIGNAINSWFNNIEWDKVGQVISNGIKGLLTFAGIALQETDWEAIGRDLATILANIDWMGLLSETADLIVDALSSGLDLLDSFINTLLENNTTLGIIAIALLVIVGLITAYNVIVGIASVATTLWSTVSGIASIATTALGAAFTFLTSPIGLIIVAIAAVIAIGILLYKNWDVVKEKILEIWNTIKDFISNKIEEVKEVINTTIALIKMIWDTVWTAISDFFSNLWNNIVDFISERIEFIKNVIKVAIEIIKTTWTNIWTGIKTVVTNIWDSIKNLISTTINTIKSSITTVLNSIKTVWNNIWNGLSDTTKKVFNGIWSAIKNVINSILGGIESMVNGVINGINNMIRALNRISFSIPDWVPGGLGGKSFGFSLSEMGTISIPKLATGGIVDQATIAMIGERGREAVLPLDRNTQWQDAVADKVAQRVNSDETNSLIRETNQLIADLAETIRNSKTSIYIDGREFGSIIESWQRSKGIQTTGGGFINAY